MLEICSLRALFSPANLLLNSTISFTLLPLYHLFSSKISSLLFMLMSSFTYSLDDHINDIDVGLYRSSLSWLTTFMSSLFASKTPLCPNLVQDP
jgi:hypothetical protein